MVVKCNGGEMQWWEVHELPNEAAITITCSNMGQETKTITEQYLGTREPREKPDLKNYKVRKKPTSYIV